MSEEEIIDYLKESIEHSEYNFKNFGENNYFDKSTQNAVKELIDLYNKEKEKWKELFHEYNKSVGEVIDKEQDLKESISKDKIRDKIKNLEKSKEFNEVITIKFRQHGFENGVNIKFLIDIMIDILKSLLQE